MTKFKGVLFDLDGTLINSEYYYYSNWQPILSRSFGLEITFEDWLTYFAGHTLRRNVAFLKDKWGIERDEAFMWTETRASYAESDMTVIRLMPFAKDILTYLKKTEIRIGLVTSSYESTVQTVLGHHNLLSYFDFFVTRENVEKPKPDAEPYLQGINRMEMPISSILAIEDTITGATSAKAAGLYCIGVSTYAIERSRLDKAVDYLATNLDEVLEYGRNTLFLQ